MTDHDWDAHLSVKIQAGEILAGPLSMFAVLARCGRGVLLPFTYRDPVDPEAPDEPRPLRRARLLVQDDGLAPGDTLSTDRPVYHTEE